MKNSRIMNNHFTVSHRTGGIYMSKKELMLRLSFALLFTAVLLLLLVLAAGNDEANAENETVGCRIKRRCDTGGSPKRVAVSGDYAYVFEEPDGLVIVNISDKAKPAIEGSCELEGRNDSYYNMWKNVAVSGDYACIARYWDGLDIIDISDKGNPVLVGQYDPADQECGVAVSGDYAYVAGDDDGLVIVDISDRTDPQEVGRCGTAGSAWGVTVSGDYAYVAASSNGLVIVDISDPANPILKGSYDTGQAENVAVSGDYAYVADYYNGLVIVDISDPANPTREGDCHIADEEALAVVVSGDYAYVSSYGEGLFIVNIKDPANPVCEGSSTAIRGDGVAVSGDYVYVAVTGFYKNLVVVELVPLARIDDISPSPALDTENIQFKGHGTCRDGRSIARFVWRSSIDGEIHNSTGESDFSTDGLTLGEHIIFFKVQDNYGVWSDEASFTLNVCKIVGVIDSVAPNPAISGKEVTFKGHGRSDNAVVKYAWCSSIDGELYNGSENEFSYDYLSVGTHIISFKAMENNGAWSEEVTTILIVEIQGHYDTAGSAVDVAMMGDYAYVADWDQGLIIIDITNKGDPQEAGQYDTAGEAKSVAVSGDYAYIADGENGLVIVDISDPANPALVGSYNTAGNSWDVAVNGDYVYVADDENGLVIVDISDKPNPVLKGQYDTAGYMWGVTVSGDYAYVADGDNGFGIIEITSPDTGGDGDDGDGNGGFLSGFEPIGLLFILTASACAFAKKRNKKSSS